MTTLRDALSFALEASETGTLETPVESAPIEAVDTFDATTGKDVTETAQAKADRIRDEGGRFATKPAEVVAPVEARKPPSSWKKDYWADWEKLDPRIKDYVDQRENEAASGVSQYKQQFDSVAPIRKALEPFLPTLQQRGTTPDKWIADLGYVDRVLSSGNPQQKQQLIYQLAARAGVQLGSPQPGQGDPNIQYLLQNQQALQQRVQQFAESQEQASAAQAQSAIDQFSAGKPHFDAVKVQMGRLIQNGFATDLPTAYDQACWSDPTIREELMASQASAPNRAAELARKRTAASSPRSASPTGALAAGNGKKSLRDTLNEQFDSVVSGRV